MPQVRYVAYGEGPEAAGGGAVCSVEELSLQARPATLGLQPCVSSLLPCVLTAALLLLLLPLLLPLQEYAALGWEGEHCEGGAHLAL